MIFSISALINLNVDIEVGMFEGQRIFKEGAMPYCMYNIYTSVK